MPAALELQILAYTPTAFLQCVHCENVMGEAGLYQPVRREQLESGLPPELAEEYGRVSDWVREQVARHGDRIAVAVVDVASVQGFWKSLRHRVHRFPAVIVGGEVFAGTDLGAAADALARRLG